MSYTQAVILAILEGLTEFLPVSSTGHLVIASSLMGISGLPITKVFTVNIQFGTILSVVVLYWRRFVQGPAFYAKLLLAFLPAAFIGLLLSEAIDALLESVMVTALMLIAGGVVLLFVDRWFAHAQRGHVSYGNALVIGFCQCIAMVPGVSRSAASIIGGLAQGVGRKAAAEFSFFLAVPTMLAAGAYKLVTELLGLELMDLARLDWPRIQASMEAIHPQDLRLLLVGNLVGFVVAMAAIRFFIGFLTRYGFRLFGYYRIALGAVLLSLLASGVELGA